MSILKRIIKAKKLEVKQKKEKFPMEKLLVELMKAPANRNFRDIFEYNDFSVIAEIKRKSPSKGVIKANINVRKIAENYEKSGARAISVVTDKKFFDGRLEYIEEVKKYTSLPVLRKDFIIDEYQIYESRLAKADAVLIIAAALDKKSVVQFVRKTRFLNMTPIVEVHSGDDLKKAISSGTDIIGINTRDLKTFKTNFGIVKTLMKKIPKDKIVIIESGMTKPEDLDNVATDPRIKGALIGTMFMKMPDKDVKDAIGKMQGKYGA
ncbi:MAG: indole-3-glycerol phosphate synthase TrpC [Spirochaetia bacterium]|nr:indole-3-glycerol phosphate synthase TrpC [Spirochaetia bacterium]